MVDRTADSSSSGGSVVNIINTTSHISSIPIPVSDPTIQIHPAMLDKTSKVILSPGKEALTAIDQTNQNASNPDPHVISGDNSPQQQNWN